MNDVTHLGAILSTSGEASQDAQGIKDGIELAVKKLSANGQNVVVHYIDDNSDVVTSVRAIDVLMREHNVRAIIGPTWAHQVDSFAPIIDQEKIVTFAPAVASDSIIKHSKFLLFGTEKNLYKEAALKKFIVTKNIKKIGIILSQDKWGVSHLLPIKNAAMQTGVEIVFIEQLIPYISSFGHKYIRETISQALETRPDLIIWSGYEGEADVLTDFLLENELSIPIIGDQLLVSGRRGERLQQYNGDLHTFSHSFQPDFITLFNQEYNKMPALYSDTAYDVTMLLTEVISKYPNSAAYEMIDFIKSNEYSYRGLSGEFRFDDRGDKESTNQWIIEKFQK